MDDDLHELDQADADAVIRARLDLVHAEFRGVAGLANTLLEAFEGENMPTELAHRLVADWHVEFWRVALRDGDIGRSALVDGR